MEEIWKDIKGYEGLYQVSNLGRIKSLDKVIIRKDGIEYIKRGTILKPSTNTGGYLQIGLSKNGIRKLFRIHRLVAIAFIPNPHNKPFIDHINTIKTDNKVENLRWVTREENANNPLTRKHISESNSNEKHWNYGKHPTNETKQKMSESKKGKYICINNPNYGNHMSDESKQKISESNKGRKHSKEFKEQRSKKYKGSNNPNALKLICIFPNGSRTEPMCQKELAEYLRIDFRVITKLVKSKEPYNICERVKKTNPYLIKLIGIKIIEVGDIL